MSAKHPWYTLSSIENSGKACSGTGNNESTSGNTSGMKYESHQLRGLGSRKPKDPYSITQIGVTMIDGSESQEEMVKARRREFRIEETGPEPNSRQAYLRR